MPTKKVTKKKAPAPKAVAAEPTPAVEQYWFAVGRRKTAVSQVRLYLDEATESGFTVNKREMKKYFPTPQLQNIFLAPFKVSGMLGKFRVSVLVRGGGPSGQADATRLGLARALVKYDGDLRPLLKVNNLLVRDARVVERKKPGLKKARRAPQWSKR